MRQLTTATGRTSRSNGSADRAAVSVLNRSQRNSSKAPAPAKDSGGWFWTRHGVWDSHIPECFPYIQFSTNTAAR